jgi:Ca-activated chloride channel family protein
MNSLRRAPWSWLALTLAATGALTWAAFAAESSNEVAIAITNPVAGETSYGEFELEARVFTEEVLAKVEFWVDGKKVGVATERPYRVRVDVGYENQEHTYKVVATTAAGKVKEEILVTPAISVDMELDLNLQQLYVTVARGRERTLDLNRSDFTVYDGDQREKIVTFERGEVPITAVVLLDSSESMVGGRLEKALAGARTFVSGLQELDQSRLLLFSDQVLVSTEFSNDADAVLASLEGVSASGGTAVNDHLYMALKQLETQPGRPVVVLFSDGTDAHSVMSMRDVLWKARRSQALVYWVRLEGPATSGDTISTAWRNGDASKEEANLLDKVVNESGGSTYTIRQPEELASAFGDILAELREQYVIGYYPSESKHDGSWRKVRVAVDRGGVRVRHREGYVDE